MSKNLLSQHQAGNGFENARKFILKWTLCFFILPVINILSVKTQFLLKSSKVSKKTKKKPKPTQTKKKTVIVCTFNHCLLKLEPSEERWLTREEEGSDNSQPVGLSLRPSVR